MLKFQRTGKLYDADGNNHVAIGIVRSGPDGIAGANTDRIAYFVINAGCGWAQASGTTVHIALRRKSASDRLVSALMLLALEKQFARYIVFDFDDQRSQWQVIYLGHAAGAVTFFAGISDERARQRVLAARARAPDDPTTKPQLKSALEVWKLNRLRTSVEALISRLSGSYTLNDVSPHSRSGYLFEAGFGLPDVARGTLAAMIGVPFGAFPDRRYDRFCIDSYVHVATTFEPVLQDVDASVYWPSKGWVRRRYQRLMLPLDCERDPTRTVVLSGTIGDNTIDLRPAFV